MDEETKILGYELVPVTEVQKGQIVMHAFTHCRICASSVAPYYLGREIICPTCAKPLLPDG